jgi:signal transduction histidine kinase/predicted RNA-binding protein with RPS1 domain
MNPISIKELYLKGKIISVKIDKVDHYGGYVNLDGGFYGFIPIKELGWTHNILDAREKLCSGEIIEVLILDYFNDRNGLLLSLKRTSKDPWYDFRKKHRIGDIVIGEVYSILNDRAYIEIENEIEGIITLSQIWIDVDKMEEALIIKDNVVAKIIEFDNEHHTLILSISALFDRETLIPKLSLVRMDDKNAQVLEQVKFKLEKKINREYNLNTECKNKIKNIIIIDSDVRTRNSLILILESIGINSLGFGSFQESKSKFETIEFDILFTVLNIPDLDEIENAVKSTEINKNIPIIIQINEKEREEFSGKVKKIILKHFILISPWNIKNLIDLLNNFSIGNLNNTENSSYTNSFLSKIKNHNLFSIDKSIIIKDFLTEIKNITNANLVIIFKLNLTTFEVTFFESIGNFKSLSEKDRYLLRFSPVKDVIYNNVELVEYEATSRKFLHLNTIGNFRSIIGEKIDISSEWGFGLFLFGKESHQFSYRVVDRIKESTLLLGTIIERYLFENIYKSKHNLIIAGQLSSMLIHELNHEQQLLFNCFDILKTDSIKLNAKEIEPDDVFLSRFQEVTEFLLDAQNKIININDLFLNLVRINKIEKIEINHYVEELLVTLRNLAEKENIEINISKGKRTYTNLNINYLNQVIINLIINSIEQIKLIRKETGKIDVNINIEVNSDLPIKLRIVDNGPGIHEIFREKIFDIFFTTKKGGSGLGLYITKTLINSLNGRIIVEDTKRFGGTSFLIELPILIKM